ncbi:MAG: RNA pseudouridine synthase [Puniceicoccales bacterium]|nr:RNA pseudouridine synthase [Puniceicoccales bacterium]
MSSGDARWTDLWPGFLKALHRRAVPIRCDDFGLCAVDKGAGILSHPNGKGCAESTLVRAPYDPRRRAYLLQEGPVFLINRLDAATEGILLLSLDEAVATAVGDSFAAGKVHKAYHAIVLGQRTLQRERWTDQLRRQRQTNHIEVRTGGPLRAETDVLPLEKILSPHGPLTLLQLCPITGKTHQLRVQCAARHAPILGDELYGDFSVNRSLRRSGIRGMQLHSSRLRLCYSLAGNLRHFAASAPSLPDFLGRWQLLRTDASLRCGPSDAPRLLGLPATPTLAKFGRPRL